MNSFGSVQVLGEDGERVLCRRWRDGADRDGSTVLAVLPATEHPTSGYLERLKHEFGLKDELDSAWAAQPLELIRERGQTLLVLADPGGAPLDRLLGAPMEIGTFLRLAVSLSAALGGLHRRRLIHKDIKPANVLVDSAASRVWLTGFGIASRLPRERQAPEPPEFIAGTLAYMAPEQTGRMNRSIDSRSDLYALGVTFYQMLTGRLPYSAADPMEWVHCHIARRPAAPAERLPSLPAVVSEIVMKLIAKTAEERYQTVGGVEHDLRRCLLEWERHGRIEPFALGERDTPDRLRIPEKLYGREREVEALLAAFERVATNGSPELVLVSGHSGIGKSSVVNELHKALVPPHGLFASGKFDQHKRDVPYSTLVQAFQSLVRSLLSKSNAELSHWREALLEALGPNGGLMVDLIPELKLIIGDQPPVAELDPQQAQGRFQLLLRRFVGVFARPEHPLALFLDDLQWLDAATLDLIEHLLARSDLQHLLLIGAYRANEVDRNHSLMRKLEALRNRGARIEEITLAPLTREHVEQWTAEALRCEPGHAIPLAQLVHEKTGGNPFFLIQFLHALAAEDLLSFDHDAARWRWDLNRIHAKGYTDNEVDLMIGKLNRLPLETQSALQQLACIGNVAEFKMLSIVLETPEAGLHGDLWEACRQELIERVQDSYRFVHDRVQEAAYSLIPESSRADAHLRIGRRLAGQTPREEREERIFEIVGQLNRGAALITSPEEREQLAELNLIAGVRAKVSTAYASAQTYFIAGAGLLPSDCPERLRELAFALELNRAECEFLMGALVVAEERFTELSRRAVSTLERAKVACLRLDLYVTLGQSSRAIEVGLDHLRHIGIDWSPHPSDEDVRGEYERIWSQLGSRTVEDLVDLPLMTDPASLATMDVLAKIGPPAWFSTEANLYALAVGRAVNLSLERGNSDGSCDAFVRLGLLLGERFGDYQAGFRFGEVARALVERRGLRRFQARTYMLLGAHLYPCTRHVRAGIELVRRAFEIASGDGDLSFAAYCCFNLNEILLAAGEPLIEVQREAEHGFEFSQRTQFGDAADYISSDLGLVRTLRGSTPRFGSFDDLHFDERRFEDHLAPNVDAVGFRYWIRKLQARFHAGDHAVAVDAAIRAEGRHASSVLLFDAADYHFYGALSRAACASPGGADRQEHLDALAAHHESLESWAMNCPENFEGRVALVAAELARIESRELDAMRLYEQAIESARANNFAHVEAIANELAGQFYAARGFEKIARVYLRDARHAYLRWGADGKVWQLDRLHPHLREDESAPDPTSTIGAPIEQLDLATVVKVLQAASSEIVLANLLEAIMRMAIEQAGAERGVLILSREGELRIAAEARTAGDAIVVDLLDDAMSAAALPESVLRYVTRAQEDVILDDAMTRSPFAGDAYVLERRARSILCLPLLNKNKLTGVLYLENNLAAKAFAPTRIAVLKLLASQAAISLEKTHLYRDLAEREAKIRRLVEADIVGIVTWEFADPILEANDAFLRMFGYDREDLVSGRIGWSNLRPPEVRDPRRIVELRTTGKMTPFETALRRKDGSRVPVLMGAASFEHGGNQGIAFVLDLTERRAAEEALRDSEEQWKAVFENNPTMYFMLDPRGTILSVNLFGARQLGYTTDELIGQSVGILSQEVDGETVARNLALCLERLGQTMTWELRKLRKDGEVLWVRETARAMLIKRQPVVLIACEDVTERRRTAEALYEVQIELTYANRVATMGQLTASIAHEVNQPIGATVANAEAALRWLGGAAPDLDEARRALARIVRDGHRAGEIIGRIRGLVKRAPPQSGQLDIHEAIREVVELTRSEAAKNGVSMLTDLGDGSAFIHGDRVQLQQVILNLIINAVEAMSGTSEGPRELRISTQKDELGGVVVAVRDSGPGLEAATLERLFEPFYTTKPGGLGMGLSICRSIVEAQGGRLWATANTPRGAIFQFALSSHPEGR